MSVSGTTPTPAPTVLTCPEGEYVWNEGGLLAEPGPSGFMTREAAVEAWLERAPGFSHVYVIADGGKAVWLLRSDGTAETRLRLLPHHGFFVHGYDGCA